jgi:hypothetical protein
MAVLVSTLADLVLPAKDEGSGNMIRINLPKQKMR